MNEVTIYTQAQPLTVKEYHGERVITFKDVDTLHQRPEGTARRNFNTNRSRFIEGEDFFHLTADEIRTQFLTDEFRTLDIPNRGLTVLTKMGYLMLVKSFTDDLAWMVQRQLVRSYFEAQPTRPVQMLPTAEGGKKPLPRMRTLPQAVKEMKEKDPQTCITLNALRQWVKSGEVPSRKIGKNYLVNLDELERFYRGGVSDGQY